MLITDEFIEVEVSVFPDFLCVGAQKAGTSWLYANLRRHPKIVMRRKEIHYFDKPYYMNKPLPSRMMDHRFRVAFVRSFTRHWRRLTPMQIMWNMRYFFGARSDEWYASMFQERSGVITGDVTPAYSILDEPTVRHIAEMMPELKVILLLRNPIERAYSAANMTRNSWQKFSGKKGDRANAWAFEDYVRYFESQWVIERGDYPRIIANWSRYFESNQFFIGFFEDIARNPAVLLDEVCSFLDIGFAATVASKASTPRNVGKKTSMPDNIGRYLANRYITDMRKLEHVFSNSERNLGHVQEWIAGAEEWLGSPQSTS